MNNKVSIIIPCYNSEKYLTECLDSILKQDVEKEIICVNDGSTDQTLDILRQFVTDYSEVNVLDMPNSGAPAARNAGFSMATGAYINYTDADDVMLPGKLQKQLAAFADEVDIVISDYELRDQELINTIAITDFQNLIENPLEMAICSVVSTMGPVYRKTVVERVGGYNVDLTSAQDWEFNLKIVLEGFVWAYVPEVLHYHREVAHSISANWHKVSLAQHAILKKYKEKIINHQGCNDTVRNYISNLLYNTLVHNPDWDEQIWKELNFWSDGNTDFIGSVTKKKMGRLLGLKGLIKMDKKRVK